MKLSMKIAIAATLLSASAYVHGLLGATLADARMAEWATGTAYPLAMAALGAWIVVVLAYGEGL